MAGYGGRGGGGRGSGGSSVAAGRAAQAKYKMQAANKRFKALQGRVQSMPNSYAPRFTRR